MKRIRINWIRRMTGGLALLAALACSVMPGGLIPKVAGRCGQALCNCEPEPVVDVCNLCHSHLGHNHFSFCSLRLVTTTISGVDVPGVAFQVVFNGFLAPVKTLISHSSEVAECASPERASFALSSVSDDISTPPPKA